MQTGFGGIEFGESVVELLFGLDALFAQCLEAIEAGSRDLRGSLGAGKPAFRFSQPRALLGIVEEDHDLTLFHRVSFFHADPSDGSHKTRAEFDSFAIDNVAARGEQRVTRRRRRRRSGSLKGSGRS